MCHMCGSQTRPPVTRHACSGGAWVPFTEWHQADRGPWDPWACGHARGWVGMQHCPAGASGWLGQEQAPRGHSPLPCVLSRQLRQQACLLDPPQLPPSRTQRAGLPEASAHPEICFSSPPPSPSILLPVPLAPLMAVQTRPHLGAPGCLSIGGRVPAAPRRVSRWGPARGRAGPGPASPSGLRTIVRHISPSATPASRVERPW